MAEKAILQISPCTVSQTGIINAQTGKAFKAKINPAGYDQKFVMQYGGDTGRRVVIGQAGQEVKFAAIVPGGLTLKEIVLDGTGVVSTTPVKNQVANLKAVVHKFDGGTHEPPVVQVAWGTLLFYGRVKDINVAYTLFKASGEPLRAKVTLTFVEFTPTPEMIKAAGMNSPDLTHLVEVRAGDTLPLLCEKVYSDGAYYLEIARMNGLTSFRELQPGMRLRFPPLG